MSKTTEEIGLLAGGISLALASGPLGAFVFSEGLSAAQAVAFTNYMIGVGLTAALGGTIGLLSPTPQDPSNIGTQGQLPVQIPNPLWRIVYGLWQFAGAITFVDGPMLDWIGTGGSSSQPQMCERQFVHRVHTLTCHQIAGYLGVVIDGQTYNFGTDLVLITADNQYQNFPDYPQNPVLIGPIGMWGFIDSANPWTAQIFFAFDPGDPGYESQPFPFLVNGANLGIDDFVVGSTRWTNSCLQRGRSKVHVLIKYSPLANSAQTFPFNGAPQPYPLGSGRIPTIEFKIAGRILRDYRVETDWQPDFFYVQGTYVLAALADGLECVFVQQTPAGGDSGLAAPNFAGTNIGQTVTDGAVTWLNCGPPVFAAGSGATSLNIPTSNKLGGPGGAYLIADAWQGSSSYQTNEVIEAPIGWLQRAESNFIAGANRPNFLTSLNAVTADSGGTWRCLGRSPYATCLPDDDGTQNQGGFSNPALCMADFLETPRNQFGLGAVLTADSLETVVASANICDEARLIEIFADGTELYERSFAANGCFESTSAYGDVLKSLSLSMAGFYTPPGDCWRIYAGSFVPPEFILGDDDARGAVKADWRLSARDTCNGVKGQYFPSFLPINPLGPLSSSPASPAWKKVDFPPVQRTQYVAEDDGVILWKDISLDFTISLWMAQRIARIVLEGYRRQVTVNLPAKLAAIPMLAGDTVTFEHAPWEAVDPPAPTTFQIAHFIPRTEQAGEAPAVGVDMVMRQTDADVYEFGPPTSPTDYGDYSPYGQTGIGAGNVE